MNRYTCNNAESRSGCTNFIYTPLLYLYAPLDPPQTSSDDLDIFSYDYTQFQQHFRDPDPLWQISTKHKEQIKQ